MIAASASSDITPVIEEKNGKINSSKHTSIGNFSLSKESTNSKTLLFEDSIDPSTILELLISDFIELISDNP